MSRIIVLGSINMDVVTTLDRFPVAGETLFGDDVQFLPGGKGSNQAVAASRLGGQVMLVGQVGQDAFGQQLQTFLAGENLDLTHLKVSPDQPTGTAIIMVDGGSENWVVVISGSNMALRLEDVSIEINAADVVVSQFEVPQPVIQATFQRAKQVGAKTVLNPAPAIVFEPEVLPLVDYLVVNETELAFFADAPLADTADALIAQAERLRHRPEQHIILTRGKAGVLAISPDGAVDIPGRTVKAVDTTGAGDCFVGALAVALGEGQGLSGALDFANHAAALSVTKLGASVAMPYRRALGALD
jgi:ribokinase